MHEVFVLLRRSFAKGFTLFATGMVLSVVALRTAAASSKEARVTQIVRDVNLLPSSAAAHPATMNDPVREGTAVRTGTASRSELTFTDLTIDRLGADTIFSFNKAGRSIELASGSLLLRVPKSSGGAAIKNPAVTVAITGTTLILESARGGRSKLIVLEGTSRLSLTQHRDQSAIVRAGQMLDVPAGATTLTAPVNIDLDRVMKTHPLITDFPPLPSRDLIVAAIDEQKRGGAAGEPIYQGRPGGSGGSGLTIPPLLGLMPTTRGSSTPAPNATPPNKRRKPQSQDTIR